MWSIAKTESSWIRNDLPGGGGGARRPGAHRLFVRPKASRALSASTPPVVLSQELVKSVVWDTNDYKQLKSMRK